jgi:hypothetical protein
LNDTLAAAASLIDVEEAAKFCGLATDQLRQWTDSGHAPHYTANGTGPFYKKSEIRQWAKDNLIVRRGGFPVPRTIDVLRPIYEAENSRCPPLAIAATQGLCFVAITAGTSGVYFLCDGDEVVYVGQSSCVALRLGTHIMEGVKKFDHNRVFFLPCPIESLNLIEQHYIETLKPRYNGGKFSPHIRRQP